MGICEPPHNTIVVWFPKPLAPGSDFQVHVCWGTRLSKTRFLIQTFLQLYSFCIVLPRSFIRLFVKIGLTQVTWQYVIFLQYYCDYDFLCLLYPQNIHGFLGLPCLIFLFLGVKIGDVLGLHIRKGVLGVCLQIVGFLGPVFKYVGSEQVLAGGLPGEGCEGEDRRNSWINIAPSSPPPTTLIPSPNHYRQDGGEASFVCLCSTPSA